MEKEYQFLQNRFRRVFFTTLLFLVGVLIGSVSVPTGFFIALIILVLLLVHVLTVDRKYKNYEEE